MFPINIAFWLSAHGQAPPCPRGGSGEPRCPRSTLRRAGGTLWRPMALLRQQEVPPLAGVCFPASPVSWAASAARWGKEGLTSEATQHRNTTRPGLQRQVAPLRSRGNARQPRKARRPWRAQRVALPKGIAGIMNHKLVAGVQLPSRTGVN